jgi:beta-galactosidase
MAVPETITPLDAGWRFGPYVSGCTAPDFDDSGLAPVTLPHTVVPLSWQDWDPGSWERRWIYRNRFDTPPDAVGRRVFLDFDGAMTHAELSLNGTALPDHLGGYLPFSREITGLLAPSGNQLAVALDSGFNLNVPPNRAAPHTSDSVDYWQPGGLYRRVWLRTEPQVFIGDVFAKPVEVLDPARRRVVVECSVDAAVVPAESARVVVELRDQDRTIASAAALPTVTRTGRVTVTATLEGLSEVALWDLDSPNLYTVTATLIIGESTVHQRTVRIGFRDASFREDGFFLNGRRVQLFGLNRHQHYPYAGMAMADRVQRKDAEILRRELNCTMVRCSHYPQAEAFFDACDELGLLAWEEAPGWVHLGDDAWKALVVRDVGDMVRRDRNHPSIVIWGARINETEDEVELYTRTRDLAHALDDSRPTAGAMSGRVHTPNYVQDVFAEDDYHSSIGPDGDKQPELEPPRTDRPYLISEAVGTLSGPAKQYRRTAAQRVQQGQALAHARIHNIAGADPRYCGLLAWCGYDYESGAGANIHRGVKYPGVIDLFRVPKPGAAIYQAQVDPAVRPVIAPAFYWDFGSTSPVTDLDRAMICSNLDRLELHLDDEHHATVTPDRENYAHLPYPPSFADLRTVDGRTLPELRIDGYLGDRLVACRRFAADPAGDVLALDADDSVLVGDGVDATRVVFRSVDMYGAPRPYAAGTVRITLAGPAVLVGDSTFPFAETGGVGAVWIRSLPDSSGAVTVHAAHPTLGTAAVSIHIEPAGTKSTEQRGERTYSDANLD